MTHTSPRAATDTVLRALADRSRRRALRLLAEDDGPDTLGGLADRLAPAGDRVAAAGTRTDLYHRHLPLLRDAGVVAYDADTGALDYLSRPFAETVLSACPDDRDGATTPFGE